MSNFYQDILDCLLQLVLIRVGERRQLCLDIRKGQATFFRHVSRRKNLKHLERTGKIQGNEVEGGNERKLQVAYVAGWEEHQAKRAGTEKGSGQCWLLLKGMGPKRRKKIIWQIIENYLDTKTLVLVENKEKDANTPLLADCHYFVALMQALEFQILAQSIIKIHDHQWLVNMQLSKSQIV